MVLLVPPLVRAAKVEPPDVVTQVPAMR